MVDNFNVPLPISVFIYAAQLAVQSEHPSTAHRDALAVR